MASRGARYNRGVRSKVLAILVGVALIAGAAYWLWPQPPPAPEPGVPFALAQDRARRVSNLAYEVSLRLPARKDVPIPGRLVASFVLVDPGHPLAFDFAQPADHVQGVTVNDAAIEPRIANGHVLVGPEGLVRGENHVEITFTAGDESLNRNDDFLYSLFVPARASLAMPVFDQPDLKARWTLSLDLPTDWVAVSNGAETGHVNAPGHHTVIFAQTKPISTYLFAFAAGRFSIETAERDSRTFRMFHRETDAAKVARNRDAIFDLHARALNWLEQYTAIPYAFGKFDFVLIPAFQFGGMEHPGAIYYNAGSLLLDESATQNQHLGRANTISHETSHMWFGDLVTMKWFNDVWMKEVFANFMAAKIVNPSFPDVNHELRFLLQNYPAAYDVDRTEGANPIRQDLDNLSDAGSLYGAIIYQKAPIVMRQLELLVGENAFRDGLREYLRSHEFGNATWPDLIAVLDARTPADLEAWSRAWVEQPGRPTIATKLDVRNGTIASLSFDERDPRGRTLVWPERLRVLVGHGGDVRRFDVTLNGADTPVPGAAGLPAPDWVLPVGGGLGYGYFELDAATRAFLTSSLATLTDPLTRGAALVALEETVYEGAVPAAALLDELLTAVAGEHDELLVSAMLGDIRTLFWRYTPPPDRTTLAPRLEGILRAGLAAAGTTSRKAAWFNAYRGTVTTADGMAWLEQVWAGDVKIDKLPLSESDQADLALDLALRGIPDAASVLQAQHDRLKNPDRKARFEFLMPAVSGDQATRDRFFDGLKDVKNRAHEAWVLDAMRYLNHPLRADASSKYVVPALGLVREIQRTGDIFFPKRWADATLGGYQSAEVAGAVRAFINQLPPDYPPRLRWVILSSADPLFRAARQ